MNLDQSENAHIRHNLWRGSIPLEPDTVDLIYSSHTLEHLPTSIATQVIDSCIEALKPGGKLRITVPDFDKALHAYRHGDKAWFVSAWVPEFRDYSLEQCFLTAFCSPRSDWRTGFLGHQQRSTHQLTDAEVQAIVWDLPEAERQCQGIADQGRADWRHHISPWTVAKFRASDQRFREQRQASPEFNCPQFDKTIPDGSLFVELTK
jgi:SAM-dependent methyltransferase